MLELGGSGDELYKSFTKISYDKQDALELQKDFLEECYKLDQKHFPKIICSAKSNEYFSYTMEFIEGETYLDYIEDNHIESSRVILESVVRTLNDVLHKNETEYKDRSLPDHFIFNVIKPAFDKCKERCEFNHDILDDYLERIKKLFYVKEVHNLLSTTYSRKAFGDAAVGNIMVKDKITPVFIDPARTNVLYEGLNYEFAKLYQSFEFKYELWQADRYTEELNAKYDTLKDFLDILSERYLSKTQKEQLPFLKMNLLFRRLKYEENMDNAMFYSREAAKILSQLEEKYQK